MKKTNEQYHILIIDDEAVYADGIRKILNYEGYEANVVNSGEDAIRFLKKNRADLILTDYMLDGMNGLEIIKYFTEYYAHIPIILMTAYATIPHAVESIKTGAFSYYVKADDPEKLITEIHRALESSIQQDGAIENQEKPMLTTQSPLFHQTLHLAKKAAQSSANILILGESGVGKEILSNFIHQQSLRASESFVAINCQSLSENIIESELFGHVKGSYTGATEDRMGRFELAHKGTLFLDEIADLPLNTQIKLLRVLESKTIEKIGSNQPIKTDFRLITATNRCLRTAISEGQFREDFYYRINTIEIHIPPLRERKEDIPLLAEFFIKHFAQQMNLKIRSIEADVWVHLKHYHYPGNIRELKNIVERLVIFSENGVIKSSQLIHNAQGQLHQNKDDDLTLKSFRNILEKEYIEKILSKNNFNVTRTAEVLGITRRQLQNKMKSFEIDKNK